jgi:hypothetical protein
MDGGHQVFGLVDYVATLNFASMDFVRRFSLQRHKSKVKTRVRLANKQPMKPSTVCEIVFEFARHEFKK